MLRFTNGLVAERLGRHGRLPSQKIRYLPDLLACRREIIVRVLSAEAFGATAEAKKEKHKLAGQNLWIATIQNESLACRRRNRPNAKKPDHISGVMCGRFSRGVVLGLRVMRMAQRLSLLRFGVFLASVPTCTKLLAHGSTCRSARAFCFGGVLRVGTAALGNPANPPPNS